jgi:predicted Zn finger-like uncharacterized protein
VYTRCPQCQTIFRLTATQLKARAGQVRCGRCQHVFRADEHLVKQPARSTTKGAAKTAGTARKRTRKTAKPEGPADTAGNLSPDTTADAAQTTADVSISRSHSPLPEPTRVRTRTVYWVAGSALLVLLLLGQGVLFYGQELARRVPVLGDVISPLCGVLPCRRQPIDIRRLDLVETQVAPHPRYDRALRIKATIVNRAEYTQPCPLLEVSLIDGRGYVVARRAYKPLEYLRNIDTARDGLPPHVAVSVQLDITSPGAPASGYEILLLAPAE